MKLTKNTRMLLWSFFVILSVSILSATYILSTHTTIDESNIISGSATAQIGVCINTPPYWLNPIECQDFYSGNYGQCDLSAIHDGENSLDYTIINVTGNENATLDLFSDIDSQGVLSVNASLDQVGNYTLVVSASDTGYCPLTNQTTFNLTIFASDQAPIFNGPIPNSTFNQDVVLIPYNLNDYFVDPEGFPLAYRAEGNSQVKVDISSAGEVTYTPAQDFCGQETLHFVATDVTNLTARSNDITLTIICLQDQDALPEGDQEQSSGGGGGGGGGAASGSSSSCVESYYCYDWSDCQYTEAITQTGDAKTINITGVRGSRIYTVEEPLQDDEELLYQGYQWRECIDTRSCTDRVPVYVRSCEYTPSCSDGIQNQDETGVDCGGVCGPCHTCTDGIQNGLETGVDCGGPSCEPCNTCTDGIMNGQELGVDCGGPNCPTCATCFDEIQNQGETGVDCGGPNCPVCVEEQEPAVFASALTTVLAILAAALLTSILAALLAKKYVIKLLAIYMQKYKNTNRILLLSQEQKQLLLEKIRALQEQLSALEPIQLQQAFAEVVRSYTVQTLGVEREYTQQDVADALMNQNIHEQLEPLLKAFIEQATQVEFSTDIIDQRKVHSMISELQQIIYQTSVLNVAELREFEQLPNFTRPNTVSANAVYSLLGYGQYLLSASRVVLAQTTYEQINDAYTQLDKQEQELLYPEIHRYFLALNVELAKKEMFLYGKMMSRL